MKLTWGKRDFGSSFSLLPRAELTPEEETTGKATVQVSLSRAPGKCIYALSALDQHDGHAPRWLPSGAAPEGSTAPNATADGYMKRVQADVEAQGITVTAVEIVELKAPAGLSAYEDPDEPDEDEDWKKYGVN